MGVERRETHHVLARQRCCADGFTPFDPSYRTASGKFRDTDYRRALVARSVPRLLTAVMAAGKNRFAARAPALFSQG